MPIREPKGLKIEDASSAIARDLMGQHLATFQFVIRGNDRASRSTVAAYVDGLAGAVTLAIAGGRGSKDDLVEDTIRQFRDAVDRDLRHMKAG